MMLYKWITKELGTHDINETFYLTTMGSTKVQYHLLLQNFTFSQITRILLSFWFFYFINFETKNQIFFI